MQKLIRIYIACAEYCLLFALSGALVAALAQTSVPVVRNQVVQRGLMAEYSMVDCTTGTTLSGTTLHPCNLPASDTSKDGTLTNTSGSGTPTADATGLNFNSGTPSTQKQSVKLANNALSGVRTMMIFADVNTADFANSYGPILGTTASGGTNPVLLLRDFKNSTSFGQATDPTLYTDAGGFRTTEYATCTGPCSITFVTQNLDLVYVNGAASQSYSTAAHHDSSGSTTTGVFQLGGWDTGGYYYQGRQYYAVFYSVVLTATEIAENQQYIQSILTQKRGVVFNPPVTSTSNQLACQGDSIMNGNQAGNSQGICGSGVSPTDTFTITNFGISGTCTSQMVDQAGGLLDPVLSTYARRNVAVLEGGTNSVAGGANCTAVSAATAFNTIVAWGQQRRAKGWKTIVFGMLSRTGTGFGGATNDALMAQLNALIFANCATFADYCINDPLFMVAGASSNTTIYNADGIHPNSTGTAILQAQLTAAVNTISQSLTPQWYSYAVAKVANATSGCANANGCWTINGGGTVAATAGLSQAITLLGLPAGGDVDRVQYRTTTACANATTIQLTGIGTTGTAGQYTGALTYDLAAATGNTNFSGAAPTVGSDTRALTNVTATITTTGSNVDQITAGCAFRVDVRWAVAP